MPTESLILRRVYPVPVTFADLRRAHAELWYANISKAIDKSRTIVRTGWHAAIKEVTGAIDEVYAVIDGREVRVAIVDKTADGYTLDSDSHQKSRALHDLMEKAEEVGYRQNPHEIVHVLSERPVSFAAVERAVNVGWCAKGGAA